MQELFLKPEILWFIAGFILLGAELITSGFIIIFFGFGAWGVSLICFLFKPSLDFQLTAFLVISIILLILFRKWLSSVFSGNNSGRNFDDLEDLVGQKAVVSKPIKPESGGKVFFRGCEWDAESKYEVDVDSSVVIRGTDSIRLIVEPVEK